MQLPLWGLPRIGFEHVEAEYLLPHSRLMGIASSIVPFDQRFFHGSDVKKWLAHEDDVG